MTGQDPAWRRGWVRQEGKDPVNQDQGRSAADGCALRLVDGPKARKSNQKRA